MRVLTHLERGVHAHPQYQVVVCPVAQGVLLCRVPCLLCAVLRDFLFFGNAYGVGTYVSRGLWCDRGLTWDL